MLLKAGRIELAGRAGPGEALSRRSPTVRVAPDWTSGFTNDLRAAMLDEVQRGWAEPGRWYLPVRPDHHRLRPEQALELFTELAERARELEEADVEPLTITTVFHPPTSGDSAREERRGEVRGQAAAPRECLQHEHGVCDGHVLEVFVAGLERHEHGLDGFCVADHVLRGQEREGVADVAGEVVARADRIRVRARFRVSTEHQQRQRRRVPTDRVPAPASRLHQKLR